MTLLEYSLLRNLHPCYCGQTHLPAEFLVELLILNLVFPFKPDRELL